MRSPSQSTNHTQDSHPEFIGAEEEDSQPPPGITMGAGAEDSQPVPPLPNLPPEITVDILSRLPVKSLLQLRCVCKSWRSLISGREFAKTHLSPTTSINTDYTNHRLLITSLFPVVSSCSLYSTLNEHSNTDVVELDYPLRDGRGGLLGVRVLGCCDGLVCIEIKSTLFLWNPSTMKSKRLPSVDLPRSHAVVYGFGYDASIDDYKVVGFPYDWQSGIAFEVKVYTLRTDSWRMIGDFPHGDLPYRHSWGVFVNGAFHWNVSRETKGIIVSLDLAKETYGEILKPEYRDGLLYEKLCAFNGCLCVLYDYCICADVWVMKEYGIRDSWTKLAMVPYVTKELNLRYSMPFCIFKNGELLLFNHQHLVRYNLKDGTFTCLTTHIDITFNIHPYVESLVSVDMDVDKGFHGGTNTKGNKGTVNGM